MAHFFYIHQSFPTYFKNIFENQTATQIMKGVTREDSAAGARAPAEAGRGCSATPPWRPTTAPRS